MSNNLEEMHIVERRARFMIVAPGPAPEQEPKFTIWDWDEKTTPRMIFQKGVERLKQIPAEWRGGGAAAHLYEKLDYFSLNDREFNINQPLPRFRWLAIYAVEGSCEGHYIHVSIVCEPQDAALRRPTWSGEEKEIEELKKLRGKYELQDKPWIERILITGKTFDGMGTALDVVKVLTEFYNQ